MPRSTPASGAASVKWWASSGRTRREIGGVGVFERLADAQVQLRAANTPDLVVDRAADELVGEPARRLPVGQLLEHPHRDRLLDRRDERRSPSPAASASTRSSNRGPGHGRQLEHRGRLA